MVAARMELSEREKQLLVELAQVRIQRLREQAVFDKTPHDSQLEQAASEFGKQLSREAQQQAAREVLAECPSEVSCPTCRGKCAAKAHRREVTSIDGSVTLDEAVAYCSKCRKSFFPSAG